VRALVDGRLHNLVAVLGICRLQCGGAGCGTRAGMRVSVLHVREARAVTMTGQPAGWRLHHLLWPSAALAPP
jgi:hypothetical protein